MFKLGDKVFIRDGWIKNDNMIKQGEIIEIGYYKNSESPIVVFVEFDYFVRDWFPIMALKKE